MMKQCSKCKKIKPKDRFWGSRIHRGGLRPDCSDCCRKRAAAYRARNRTVISEKNRAWRIKNKPRISAQRKVFYIQNRERILDYQRERFLKHRERILDYHHRWYIKNKEREIERIKKWFKAHPENALRISRRSSKKQVATLTDNYIRNILRGCGIPLTGENISAARLRIIMKRSTRIFKMINAASNIGRMKS